MALESTQSNLTMWNIDFNDLAKQICLKDLELFKAITIEEINSFNWSKASTKALCQNLMISNKQFNKINLWVQKEILDQKKSVVGKKVISKFINLSKRLLEYKNFQSAYAVKSALHSTSIYRLEYMWSETSKKDKATWDKLMSVFTVENNYSNLRKAMDEAKKPCIPFLGIYLCDLTGLDAAHPLINGVEPQIRKDKTENIYKSIRHFQTSKYDFKLNLRIQNYLLSKEYMEEFQNYIIDTLFDLSKALEPDSNGIKQPQSSQNPTFIMPASPFSRNNKFQPSNRKCNSHEPNEIYRKISDSERETVYFTNPDSPTLINREVYETKSMKMLKIRNLLDDSVLEEKRKSSIVKDTPESPFIAGQNGCSRHHSPTTTMNHVKDNNNNTKTNSETQPAMTYVEPDILTSNINLKLIIEGSLKKKTKIKNSTFCLPLYQKVLVRLYISNLECYLSFFMGKVNKPKCLSDFRDESLLRISFKRAKLNFKNIPLSPKIIIDLPHEAYILKSIDEVGEEWPTIDQWWQSLNDAQNQVNCSKTPVSQSQKDLINLEDDFTRL